MQSTTKKKTVIIVGVVVFIIIVLSFILLSKNKKEEVKEKTGGVLIQEENILPTVDSSVKVEFTSSSEGKEAILRLSGIPSGTESIDYELSYQEAQKGLQGVIGTIMPDNQTAYEKKITLGTCSSGRCVYHEIIGKVKVTLKFVGSYGDKIYEKEYDI
ncbi:hypothetical protein A2334_05210 [Candidatus Roizmanbacteria bacterium RIFOXYB2_FULL_38_10]|uniref:Uncharacterized protein n=1 Tax=Candidatus Roizmanbacteria bacterium RIFOXYD1_FULL_38_12 TaxID=1802093 RepID=A0A1F7L034_9BACT|nr:MAG: hypothetical protein A3K47_01310 [Candidatus Roizmanbacteria bacterium RIFOXYA2_FULL_38_14]OGK63423.1 MAG: hypothetical protein A3K27_01310 [Candidatus Roizmanbacteria bacterium RIFOXYA1_FULL_37_12]OGK65269.1 MAG: hypothetical protein A3K38_01310 [Candidatus Roizmanbacteria bacterium RIFOXYB1_FULL_40_23]OGK68822.1 MAG: hypothetical protein A2334_05210 [Candidatus Roizmanbacteria bacterium RIFOXYB2_FULL_38_10]OGK69674.1 MAG: hypothetical protein A3K21_01315 [Candidatus Roizmanbacteria ba